MAATATEPRLKARYKAEIVPALNTEFGFSNIMQTPRVVKVVVNMGVGEAAKDSKLIEGAIRRPRSHDPSAAALATLRLSIASMTESLNSQIKRLSTSLTKVLAALK